MPKSLLLSPITIGRHTFKNRVFMSPMCMYNSHNQDGVLDKDRFDHYTMRAFGGVGAIVVEATHCLPNTGLTPLDLGLYNDTQEQELKKLVDSVHYYGTKIGIQLAHAGRKGTGYSPLYAPSAIQFDAQYEVPVELNQQQLEEIKQGFVQAAQRAYNAGFDFIEIHAAHGYLLSSFLSPISNQRDDDFGGSLANRYRFVGDIIKAIKANVDIDMHLRISAHEGEANGNSIEDIAQILKWAQEDGVVFFDISSSGITPTPPNPIHPGFQAIHSAKLSQVGLDVGAVGLLDRPELAEYILRRGDAKVIYLGRPLLRNPFWVAQAASDLHDEHHFSIRNSYARAFQ